MRFRKRFHCAFALLLLAGLVACRSADTVLRMQSDADRLETVADQLDAQADRFESIGRKADATKARKQAEVVREGSETMREGTREIRDHEKESADLQRSAGFADGLFSLMRWAFAIIAGIAAVIAISKINFGGVASKAGQIVSGILGRRN